MPTTELSCDKVELTSLSSHESNVSPNVTILDSNSVNSTVPVADNLNQSIEVENSFEISENDSIDSLPLLECTPLIFNDMSTPNISILEGLEGFNPILSGLFLSSYIRGGAFRAPPLENYAKSTILDKTWHNN